MYLKQICAYSHSQKPITILIIAVERIEKRAPLLALGPMNITVFIRTFVF